MTRFNTVAKTKIKNTSTKRSKIVTNHEGETAYSLTAELELYSLVCTCIMQDKFYETSAQEQTRMRDLLRKVSPEFVAQLAVYAREQMYLRTIPLVLAVELAKIHNGDSLVSKLTERIIQRADEITEILAYYQIANKRTGIKKLEGLSKQIQKGVAGAFNKFSEYQFAKYDSEGDIKLKDALFIAHPSPKDKKQQKIFDKIVAGTLEVPYTWEVELSKLGQCNYETQEQKDKAFKRKWEELIDSGKIGYMAMLRNLRNIVEAKVSDEHIKTVCNFISDAEQVAKSKQLPFRFYSAYLMLKECGNKKILNAIAKALDASAVNVPELKGNVLTAIDLSSSMDAAISPKSIVSMKSIGAVLGCMFASRNEDSVVVGFGETMKVIPTIGTDSILTNVEKVINANVGHSTNAFLVIEYALKNNLKIDNFVIFTDCQCYDSTWGWGGTRSVKALFEEYVNKVNKNAKIILFDVAGYGNTPVDTKKSNVTFVSGWSDKVFNMLASLQKGSDALKEIKGIKV